MSGIRKLTNYYYFFSVGHNREFESVDSSQVIWKPKSTDCTCPCSQQECTISFLCQTENTKAEGWFCCINLLKKSKMLPCKPSPLLESNCREMSSVLDKHSWPFVQKLLEMKFTLLQPFHLAADNEQIVPKSPLMKTVRICSPEH